jgi:hypothetical protein
MTEESTTETAAVQHDPQAEPPPAPELPEQVPTGAAILALQHVLNHGHDGVDPVDHYCGALVDLLGLVDPVKRDLAIAEQAIVRALSVHPRDQARIDTAMAEFQRLTG